MLLGVPKEIKVQENRVALTPQGVAELRREGHSVIVETNAGGQIGFDDKKYAEAGAEIVSTAAEIFHRSEIIVKVKEPQPHECRMLNQGQILFTYLHLAPDPEQAQMLQDSECTAIAYETITDAKGDLPLLKPMSQVAGRLAVQAGARCLEISSGGPGILLGGVPSVDPAKVIIIGGGTVGTHAAQMAVGLRAEVTIFDRSMGRLEYLDEIFSGQVRTVFATEGTLKNAVIDADLVVGAVLLPGAEAPKLIPASWLKEMRTGAVLVDVAIDQGGCFESSHPTTHDEATFERDGVIHYCVANMPGAVARTSTLALTNATFPYISSLAGKGVHSALLEDSHFANGLNVHNGKITNRSVAQALGKDYVAPETCLVIN